ncbi:MAG TPA: NUDIX hydrolase [Paenirhodobacter sp.]
MEFRCAARTHADSDPIDKRDTAVIRDAATILVLRHDLPGGTAVLMGQRGTQAAFMPAKFVFPGGAVDDDDAQVRLGAPPDADSLRRLGSNAHALAAAAIRELWEETGLILGRPGHWPDPPAAWRDFAASGFLPDASGLRHVFRAITPAGRSRRFDARFFVLDARHLRSDPDDFSRAGSELSLLQWVPLTAARHLDLPFITEVVLAEVQALLDQSPSGAQITPASVPFFDTRGARPVFARIS